MEIYVIRGITDGSHATLLVTTNFEKAKAFLISDGFGIEVWENDMFVQSISYFEEEGFVVWEV